MKKNENDEFILIDVSDKSCFDPIVQEEKVVGVIDHHYGFEDYWNDKIGNNSNIEFIGAVITLIVEEYERDGLLDQMPKEIAMMSMAAILDNTLNFKAKVTTERDKIAYNKLKILAGCGDDFEERYFVECQQAIESNLKDAIENDLKVIEDLRLLPHYFGQLTIWNKDFVLRDMEVVKGILNSFSNDWILNLICLGEDSSFILVSNDDMKSKVEELFNKTCENNIMDLGGLWLRKEIIKKAREEE